jgi:hypothetical protein
VSTLDYHLRGWRIVPIPAGQKQPAMQGWPDFRPAAEDLARLFNGKNIGLIVGVRSGSVVDAGVWMAIPEGMTLDDARELMSYGIWLRTRSRGQAARPSVC